jgi:hypothetical protein
MVEPKILFADPPRIIRSIFIIKNIFEEKVVPINNLKEHSRFETPNMFHQNTDLPMCFPGCHKKPS